MQVRLTQWSGRWAVLAVALLLLPVLVPLAAPPVQAVRPPNIILIVTDDQDARSLREMPNVRRLLKREGTAFSNFLVTVPSCCPSRASILRGQYVHNHGVLRNEPPNGGFQAFRDNGHEQSNVATWLDAAGYQTGLFGKYLNEYDEVAPRHVPDKGWDRWFAWAGLGKYFDYRVNGNGRLVDYGHDENDYETDVFAREARRFINDAVADRRPFFAYIAPHAPHDPAIPAPRHKGEFANARAPRVPSFNEVDMSDKPSWMRDAPKLSRDLITEIDALHRNRLRSLQAVDDMVGALIETLRDTRTLDNTFIFFTSDNGFHQGEHRLASGKGTPYEESIRVPLLVRGPGVAAGRVEDRLVSNIDLAPTFAELARVGEVPAYVDGRSLMPLLRGDPDSPWRKAVLVEYIREDRSGSDVMTEARVIDWDRPNMPAFWVLREAERVYFEFANGERELYDLRADPHQLDNLAADPGRAGEIDVLHARLAALQTCAGVDCRRAEDA